MANIKYNQQALNQIINVGLDDDGVKGQHTIDAQALFCQKLAQIFTSKKYAFNIFDVVGIRMNDALTDKFSDWGVMLLPANDVCFFPISTKPASYLESEKAVAILKEGQYLKTWQYQNTGWSKLPFFQQVKNVTIYRDNFGDLSITRTAPTENGMYGINLHSWLGWLQNIVWYKSLNRNIALSEGCNVAMANDWQMFLGEINKHYKIGDLLTYTLIHKQDFI